MHIYQHVYGPDDSRVADALVSLGEVQRQQGRLDTAHANLQRAMHIYQRFYGPSHSLTVSTRGLLDKLEG